MDNLEGFTKIAEYPLNLGENDFSKFVLYKSGNEYWCRVYLYNNKAGEVINIQSGTRITKPFDILPFSDMTVFVGLQGTTNYYNTQKTYLYITTTGDFLFCENGVSAPHAMTAFFRYK